MSGCGCQTEGKTVCVLTPRRKCTRRKCNGGCCDFCQLGILLHMKGISSGIALNLRLVSRAVSDDQGRPWFDVEFTEGIPTGAWISLRYRTSLYTPLSRPTIRFRMHSGTREFLMPAGLFGYGEWIGYVPSDTEEILISAAPTQSEFSLDLTSCRTMTWVSLIACGLTRNAPATLLAIWLYLTGSYQKARDQLRISFGSMHLERYHEWRAASVRALDLEGFDAPRPGWRSAGAVWPSPAPSSHRRRGGIRHSHGRSPAG